MAESTKLHVYEEVLLLAISDHKGTFDTGVPEYAVAGAVLSELMAEGRLALSDPKKQMVETRDGRAIGDEILDETLGRIGAGKRRASLQTWITRIAGARRLRHRAAIQLCRRGILRADEDQVLHFFRRKVYPELDPRPERELREWLRAVVDADSDLVDARTAAVISILKAVGLLDKALGKDLAKRRKERIAKIVSGEVTAAATKAVLDAVQTAVFVAAIVPAIAASTSD
ncbi:MAG TPA: GPP34 family phosphoprotein [Candidatus Eisenbacteria bacterium]|nr:GPP34 family phosphoprotein [Candidatus Eisenbacteria bacterium]